MKKTITWICDQDHLQHPFIVQAVLAARSAGINVNVYDRAARLTSDDYYHSNVPLSRTNAILCGVRLRGTNRLKQILSWIVIFIKSLHCKSDIYVGELPQTLLIAWILAKIHKGKCIYHPFEIYGEQTSKYSKLLLSLESTLLKKCIDAIVTQNIYRSDVYQKERGCQIQPVIVRNTKQGVQVKPNGKLREMLGVGLYKKIILYEGHLIPGRMLDTLVESMRYNKDGDMILVIVGQVTEWWMINVEPIIKKFGLEKVVVRLPYVSHNKITEFIADANVGVIIYDDNCRNNIYCAPGKLSDYLLAGIPVICPAYPPMIDVVEFWHVGKTFQSKSAVEISKSINAVLTVARQIWQANISKALNSYDWETDKRVLIDLYTRLI